MRVLKAGSYGPAVELLQLALVRAGSLSLEVDGFFGSATDGALRSFQRQFALPVDGVAGAATHRALLPYYTGFLIHRLRPGETLSELSRRYGSALSAILTANPGLVPEKLTAGQALTVPLPFDVVPSGISWFSGLVGYCVRGLSARYPFLSVDELGRSVLGRPLWVLRFGSGENRVLYNAEHHANEWICTPLLFRFLEELCAAYAAGGPIYGQSAAELWDYASLFLVPAVNPDGMDLCTGELQSGPWYQRALNIASNYPQYAFPAQWKANIQGLDLNLQYPAGWEQAKANKFSQGIVSPAPGDFVGDYPLQAPESAAMAGYTRLLSPALTLSYHTQGEVIYWRYLDYHVPGAGEIAGAFAEVSGYEAEETPYAAGFAGYKDWFIQEYLRPGFTVEAGNGQNPLPISDFGKIFDDNLGILTLGMIVT